MWPNPQFATDLVTFTEEILNGKLYFLGSVYSLASRSLKSGDRCNETKLEHRSSICIPPFQYDFKSAPKNKTRMYSSPDSDWISLNQISPKTIVHLMMVENSLILAAWLVSLKPFCVKKFQKTFLLF